MRISFRSLLLIIFVFVLAVYASINPSPSNLFQHYVLIANSLRQGHFNIVDKPWHYGDFVPSGNKFYFQYGLAPALLLLPLTFIWKTDFSQTYVSMIVGALNAVLMFILLKRLNIKSLAAKLLLTLFFAFGTVHFSAASTGTTWFFGHIAAVFFLLLALIENFGKRRPVVMGLFFSLAVFSRQPVFLSFPFFLLYLKNGVSFRKFLAGSFLFFLGALPLFAFSAYYNFSRFGSIFDDGRHYMYMNYITNAFPYTHARTNNPDFKTSMLDIRNIPINLYVFFLMPPDFISKFPFVSPSPYGMSVLITSPLFLYLLRAKKNLAVLASWLAVVLVAFTDFLWFAQGWVQFGYRYLLDFLPFLMIILGLAIGKINIFKIVLLLICIIVNAWGALWLKV